MTKQTEEWNDTEAHLLDKKQQNKNALPTRLPTPKRPTAQRHKSAEQLNNHIQENTNNNKPPPSVQSDPPPNSPGKRVRHSSIARLVKVPTRERLLSETTEEKKPAIDSNDLKKVRKPVEKIHIKTKISCRIALEFHYQ